MSRPLTGGVRVHGLYQANPPLLALRDRVTNLPILSFYGVDAEKD